MTAHARPRCHPRLSITWQYLATNRPPRTRPHTVSGFIQRNAGNRAKSPSVEHNVRPCSRASAAKCASGTRLACTPGSARSSFNRSAWRSVGCGIHAVSHAIQARTWCHASAIGSGRSNTRGLVTRRRKASRLTQDRPTRVVPLSCWSSHARAAWCCAKDSTCE